MSSTRRAAIILAAGQGTRMKSPLPKVLHRVGGRAMVDHAIDAAEALGCERIVVVVGSHSPDVRAHIVKRLGEAAIAVQDPPLGTGHAVLAARDALAAFDGDIVITFGDVPLLRAEHLEAAFSGAGITLVGFEARDPTGYGRLLIDADGRLEAIVEQKEASPDQLAVTACNSGVMAAPAALLFSLLAEVRNDNVKGEYYLTDIVRLARDRGEPARAVFTDEDSVMGVNSQGDLATAEGVFQKVQRETFMAAGVTMPAPDTVHFSWDTEVAAGSTIEPYVVFGPGVKIEGPARVHSFSHLEGATLAAGSAAGPFARLRPGADLGADVKVGNFVEIKNASLAEGAKASHLTYIGDAAVGPRANIGAGVIFSNYDGFFKYRTTLGPNAFIGSNVVLVAPVAVGEGAMVAAGSVVTRDIEPGDLVIARGRQEAKAGWAKRFMDVMRAKKAAKSV